jgi:hypothetical protein
MTDEQRQILDLALFDLSSDSGVRWSGEYMAEFAAALRALLAELAALKARDPLAEMWAALAEYQPQADRDGHGESWAKMCAERTVEAAGHAAQNALRFWARQAGFSCVQATGKGAFQARSAIDSIRRAKEATP